MDINKRNRTELKSYFVKNAIPTESNFADLIEGVLNQKEDGVVKLPGNPLSIEASGDDASLKKAINFYRNFSDANPDWTINLNPRSDPNNAASAKSGFNVSDGDGNSRLFIDRASGNVGIGTTTPQGKLDVFTGGAGTWNRFVVKTTRLWGDGDNQYVTIGEGGAAGIMFYNPHVVWYAPESRASIRMGRSGGTSTGHWWDIGVRSNNLFSIMDGQANVTGLSIDSAGNVGIGTSSPLTQLHIRKDAVRVLGPTLTLMNGAGGAGAGTSLDFDGYDPGTNPPTARIQSVDDGNYSSHLVILAKTPGAAANALTERLRISSNGNVGIKMDNPAKALHIERGELRVRSSHNDVNTPDIAQFYAENLSQGIGLGYDRIVAVGSNNDQEIRVISKGSSGVLLWPGGGPNYLIMQGDGNLCVYRKTGGGALWCTQAGVSDERLKENIRSIDSALAAVLRLRGVSFFWKDKSLGEGEEIGLVAQEVEKVMPYLVLSVDKKTKMVKYEKCIPLLIEAIKEQQAQIENLKAELQSRTA